MRGSEIARPLNNMVTFLRRWRDKRALLALQRAHPGVDLGADLLLESDILWRIATGAQLRVGDETQVRRGCELKVDTRAVVSIGRRVHLGPWCTLSALEAIEVGDDCLIAERVSIRDHDHVFASRAMPYSQQGYTVAPVRLGRNVWLGANVTLTKGVTLGDDCVVAAHAVVTRSFPAGSLIAGVPARLLRSLEA